MIDPFVIYGEQYIIERNNLVTSQEEGAITSFKALNVRMNIVILIRICK